MGGQTRATFPSRQRILPSLLWFGTLVYVRRTEFVIRSIVADWAEVPSTLGSQLVPILDTTRASGMGVRRAASVSIWDFNMGRAGQLAACPRLRPLPW